MGTAAAVIQQLFHSPSCTVLLFYTSMDLLYMKKKFLSYHKPAFSPLTLAVKEGNVEAVHELVHLGADVNSPDSSGITPLKRAMDANNSTMIQTLVALGANCNARHIDGYTVLYMAALLGNVKMIRVLTALGADLNTRDNDGITPAYMAVLRGNIDLLRTLVELGANLNTPDNDRNTPLYMAAQRGSAEMVKTLTELGADLNTPNKYNGDTPVLVAARHGHIGVIQTLAEGGVDLNTPDRCGRNAVCFASQFSNMEVLSALLEGGVNVNTATANKQDGETALLLVAAREGHVNVIRLLLKWRANIDLLSSRGLCPLRCAVHCGHMEAVVLLVNNGADVRHCLGDSALAGFTHIRAMWTDFSTRVGLPCVPDADDEGNREDEDKEEDPHAIYATFSLAKLMSSVFLQEGSTNSNMNAQQALLETYIGVSMRQLLSRRVIRSKQQETPYVLRRRLVRIAWRVYQSTLVLDGDRLTVPAKARRYVELVFFLLDLTMLGDVLSLRMTCKSNHERRRFPVICYSMSTYHELEANIIEEWLAYGSCRFVSTDVIGAVMAIHLNSAKLV